MKYRLGALLGVILLAGCQSSAVDVSTSDIAIPTEKPTFLYLVHMNSHHMICGNMINQMPQLDNTTSVTGDIITGFNVTAFLQPGENTLDARVASIGTYKKNGGDGSVQRASPDDFFDAIGYQAHLDVKKVQVLDHVDWSHYKLASYADGKLVQLKDDYDDSPLRTQVGDIITSYTPYFSIINGRVVISR